MHRVIKAGSISHPLPESKHSCVLAFSDTSSDSLCVPAFPDPHHANTVGCNAYHDYASSKRCNKWDGAIPLRIITQDLHIQTTGPNKVVYRYRNLYGTDNSVHQGRGERLCRTGVGLSCGHHLFSKVKLCLPLLCNLIARLSHRILLSFFLAWSSLVFLVNWQVLWTWFSVLFCSRAVIVVDLWPLSYQTRLGRVLHSSLYLIFHLPCFI